MMAFWDRWRRRARDAGASEGGIDCAGVLERLYEYIDQELDDAELMEKIRVHLEICQRCYPRFQFEKTFLEFVAELARTKAPPELKRKIFQRLLENS